MVKALRWIAVSVALVCQAAGWIHVEPADHSKLLASSGFAGIVEVTGLADTGKKKVMPGHEVAFREVKVSLKVLSRFKGEGDETLECLIYRRPSEDELIADGVAREVVFKKTLNLAADEGLHLFLPELREKDRLLVYLVKSGNVFVPVSGDEKASQSLFRMVMANQLSAPPSGEKAPVEK